MQEGKGEGTGLQTKRLCGWVAAFVDATLELSNVMK